MIKLALLLILLSLPCHASLSGRTGLELSKNVNGAWLQTIVLRGTYRIDENLSIRSGVSQSFTLPRGKLTIPNHASTRWDIGVSFYVWDGLRLDYTRSNRRSIEGHDGLFMDELDGDRDVLSLYYTF